MQDYRTAFNQFVDKKKEESGGSGGVRITVDGESGMKISTDRERGTLDLSEVPRYEAPQSGLNTVLAATVVDFAILTVFVILGFLGAFVAFLRYDLR